MECGNITNSGTQSTALSPGTKILSCSPIPLIESHNDRDDSQTNLKSNTVNYYNENDTRAAAWIEQLISDGLIPTGHVDTRSIVDVQPRDLDGYTQCHFFAGISAWPLALGIAGVSPDEPLWTMSCPCQPFSSAGKRKGNADERHLWPVAFNLIRECRPARVFGEQVASSGIVGSALESSLMASICADNYAKAQRIIAKIGGEIEDESLPVWFDGISDDLESENYACGSVVLGAFSVGAPHIRQRLYWLAKPESSEWKRTQRNGNQARGNGLADGGDSIGLADANGQQAESADARRFHTESGSGGGDVGLGNSFQSRLEGYSGNGDDRNQPGRLDTRASGPTAETGSPSGLGDSIGARRFGGNQRGLETTGQEMGKHQDGPSIANQPSYGCQESNPWSQYDLIPCRDGKYRRIPRQSESVLRGLATGLPDFLDPGWAESGHPLCGKIQGRTTLLKGYGNSLNVYTAVEFIRAAMTL